MPDKEGVRSAEDIEIQIPIEILLARLIVSIKAPVPQFAYEPSRQIASKAAGIDEIAFRLGDIKRRASERYDCSRFCAHDRRAILCGKRGAPDPTVDSLFTVRLTNCSPWRTVSMADSKSFEASNL